MVCYRLGLLWWQKGRTLGTASPPAEKIRLLGEARDLLIKLESTRPPGSPPLEPLRRALAYLLGDLAHALQLAGQRAEAEKAFSEAVGFWAQLLAVRPNSEEYEEGHAWCRQRLQELNRKEQPPADPGKR
jgi:hypothetical protein